MNKLINFLSNFKVILIAGFFLFIQLILIMTKNVIKYFDFSIITIILSSFPIYYYSILYIFKYKKITASTLVSIAITVLVIKSFAQNSFHDMFAAAEVAFLSSFGRFLEEKALKRTKKAIFNLLELQPKNAKVLVENEIILKDIEDIKIGDIIRVLEGERIPVDGIIISGNTSIDQSVLTGESLPLFKNEGSQVYTATLNISNYIDIKVTKENKDSSFSKLLNIIEKAEKNKSKIQRIVDKWAVYLVPFALFISIISFIIFYFTSSRDVLALNDSLNRATTVLVVFCPCAMLLATPTAIIASIGQATKFGLIIKSGFALEEFSKIDYICFDKTGTLTEAKLSISKIFTNNINENDLILISASAESKSNHIIAKVLKEKSKSLNLKTVEPKEYKNILGKGIISLVNDKKIHCGSFTFLEEENIKIDEKFKNLANNLRKKGEYVIFIAINFAFKGMISFSDKLKDNAKKLVSFYKKKNIKTILLSGDNENTVKYIANKLEIDSYYSECLPEDKIKIIQKLKENNKKVAMLGDGINDAGALKVSNISIAFAENGADIAVDSSDIAFCNNNLNKIAYLYNLSKKTFYTITINLVISILVNILGLIFSLSGYLTPILGALVHQGGTILVILNAIYLYERKIFKKTLKEFK